MRQAKEIKIAIHGSTALIILILCLFDTAHTTLACESFKTKKCTNYHMVRMPLFHAFIAADEFDAKCRAFTKAFQCVYSYLEGCDSRRRYAFDIQKSVTDQVCVKRRLDYKESQSCFSQRNLQQRLPQCFKQKTLACGSLDEIADCVENVVTSTDGCGLKDGRLMKSFVEAFHSPTKSLLKCVTAGPSTVETLKMTTPHRTKASTTTSKQVSMSGLIEKKSNNTITTDQLSSDPVLSATTTTTTTTITTSAATEAATAKLEELLHALTSPSISLTLTSSSKSSALTSPSISSTLTSSSKSSALTSTLTSQSSSSTLTSPSKSSTLTSLTSSSTLTSPSSSPSLISLTRFQHHVAVGHSNNTAVTSNFKSTTKIVFCLYSIGAILVMASIK